jgi:hypothetical protein
MSDDERINEIIGYQVQHTAEWRRVKAEEFPDDPRNLEAAAALDRLAEEIADLNGSDLHQCIERMIEASDDFYDFDPSADLDFELNEVVSAELRAIGFHAVYATGAEFLYWYCETFEELLRRRIFAAVNGTPGLHIFAADDGTPVPSLADQVENDEAGQAAKRAYEEARAKAYAEARKRLQWARHGHTRSGARARRNPLDVSARVVPVWLPMDAIAPNRGGRE